MKYIFTLLALFGVCALHVSADEDNQATAIMQKVSTKYRSLHTLFATFTQMTRLGNDPLDHSTSSILLRKPNLFYMTGQPEGIIIVSNGKKQLVFDPTRHYYTELPIEAHGKDSMVAGWVGVFFGADDFYADPHKLGKPHWRYLGKRWLNHRQCQVVQCILPKPEFSRQTLYIGSDHLIYREQMYCDWTGGTSTYSEITMTHPLLNLALPKATFDFKPPADAKATGLLGYPLPTNEPLYDPALVPGKLPAAMNAIDIAKKPVTLADYKGKVVLLDYWATWCGPCLGEMPNVAAAYKKHHARGLEIVGISLDEEQTPAGLAKFVKEQGMSWRQICDGKGFASPLAKVYKVTAIPFALLIGRDGKIKAVSVRGKELNAAVEAALAKP